MLIRVNEKKIVYSKETENSLEYTEKLNKAYSKYTKVYDLSVKYLPVWKKWISSAIPHIQGNRVLEVSFGTGYLLLQYAGGYETYGIDFNESMIEIARKNLSKNDVKANLQWANVEELPYPDGYFDTIINTMAFSGYPKGNRAMAEINRVLKDGGKLLIVDFDYSSNRNIFGYWLTRIMEKAGDTIRDISKILCNFNYEFTEKEIGGFGSVHLYVATKPKRVS